MSADIIGFPASPPPAADSQNSTVDGPHLSGEAFCGACGKEWVAVAPVGTTHLDCPGCKRMWGAFKGAIEPEVAWRCNCGEQLFWLTPAGALCRRCGVTPTDWANGPGGSAA